MAKITLVCWQDIPSVVEARDGATTHKIQLSQRFQELIDRVAMRQGLAGTDAYLMEWKKSRQPDVDQPAEAAAASVAAGIEDRYEEIRAAARAKD